MNMKSRRISSRKPKAKPIKSKKPASGQSSLRAKVRPKRKRLIRQERDPAGFYSMLAVSPDASGAEIISAFEKAVRAARKNKVAFVEQAAMQAFATLSDPAKRRAYDPGFSATRKNGRRKSGSPGLTIYRLNMGMVGGPAQPHEPKSWWESLFD